MKINWTKFFETLERYHVDSIIIGFGYVMLVVMSYIYVWTLIRIATEATE